MAGKAPESTQARAVVLFERLLRVLITILLVAVVVFGWLVIEEASRGRSTASPRSYAEKLLWEAEEAVEAQPDDPAARAAQARAYIAIGAFGKAREAAEEGLRLAPADPWNGYYLGLAYKGLGDDDKALKVLEKAAAFKGNLADLSAEIEMAIGRIYEGRRAYEKAVSHYEKALKIDPGADTGVMKALARLYERTGEPAKAVALYNRVLALDPGDESAVGALARLAPSGPEVGR